MSVLLGSVDYLANNIGNISTRSAHSIKKVACTGDAVQQARHKGDAGAVSMTSKLLNGAAFKRNSINVFQNAISLIQAQADALRQAEEIYQRMLNLASLAADPSLGPDERALLSTEFDGLMQQSLNLNGSTLNGELIFDPRAAATQYDISFTEGATSGDPAAGGIDNTGAFIPGGNSSNTNQPYWDVQKDVLYNSGEVTLKLKPYTMWDRFVLYQDDPSNYLFDTGNWQGGVFDEFVVKYGPDRTTTFAFTTTNNYSNKTYGSGYLTKFGLADDGTPSGMQDYYGKEVFNLGQVSTSQPNSATSLLTLRVIGAGWGTGYELDVNYKRLEMEQAVVGNDSEVQVPLHAVGLGFLREDDAANGFPALSISTQGKAQATVDAISKELEGVALQFDRLSNNSSRIETSMNAAQKELALHQTALSRTADGDFSKDLAEISKSRIARSQNAALMAQAISVSRDVANLLL